MTDRSPFRVMCDMWGIQTALKKAKEFGIEVTAEELESAEQEERRVTEALSSFVRNLRGNGATDD